MKATRFIGTVILIFILFTGCKKDILLTPKSSDNNIPEGYFEVTFTPQYGNNGTKVAITGKDNRVSYLHYIIYKSSGEYVSERVVLNINDATPSWPLQAIKDTLPKGEYTAVFLANMNKNLFPIPMQGGGTSYAEVLSNYKTSLSEARISLPNIEFSDSTEYYLAKVNFSNTSAAPNVLLQRIISMLNLHRNFVDASVALNKLVNNIVTEIHYKNYIQTTVAGLLPGLLRPKLDLGLGNTIYAVVGGLDGAVNLVADALLIPVTDVLYNQLLSGLINAIGRDLTGNASQAGALAGLGVLLNPWNGPDANTAIVTIRDFPKTIDFNLAVKDYYTGDHTFKYVFTGTGVYDEKDILIKGFNGVFNVRKINAIKHGLVSGLVVDRVIDGPLLLNGTFVDVEDPILATVAANYRYKANYSFLDLKLNSYTQQTDGNHTLTLSVKLGDIANLDDLLSAIPILGPLLNSVVRLLLKDITVSLPINLPLLGVDNLELSGSWSGVQQY